MTLGYRLPSRRTTAETPARCAGRGRPATARAGIEQAEHAELERRFASAVARTRHSRFERAVTMRNRRIERRSGRCRSNGSTAISCVEGRSAACRVRSTTMSAGEQEAVEETTDATLDRAAAVSGVGARGRTVPIGLQEGGDGEQDARREVGQELNETRPARTTGSNIKLALVCRPAVERLHRRH